MQIEKTTLNGLEGILGCACQTLNGVEAKPAIMNSMDFANMEFDTLGFKGKWLELIGDPSSNFTAMVFGRPKMGKSYLCIGFAGYLARNHGKVLYVAKEEGLDYSLKLPSLWSSAGYFERQRLQFLVFPEGIFYNRKEDKCRTHNANGAFQYIAELKRLLEESKSRTLSKKIESAALVVPTGIEPVSKV